MNALILDGSKQDDNILNIAREIIVKELTHNHWTVNTIILRDKDIAPCTGCFDCWLKTPGICIINDAGRDIMNLAVIADLWIFLTPVTFGGYSSNLKKAVDRLLPMFVPVFTNVNGEVHHRLRYGKNPILIGIGSCGNKSSDYELIFKKLIARNAINFRSNQNFGLIFSSDNIEQMRSKISNFLFQIGILHHGQSKTDFTFSRKP